MASIYYDRKRRRWRVAWRCTLPNGEIDAGSRSFGKDKETALKFKEYCDTNEKRLKQSVFVNPVLLSHVVEEWKGACSRYTARTKELYTSEVDKFMKQLPQSVNYITDMKTIYTVYFTPSIGHLKHVTLQKEYLCF